MIHLQELQPRPEQARTCTVKAAAKSLGVGQWAVERLIEGGKLTAYRDAGRSGAHIVLIDRDSLKQLERRG